MFRGFAACLALGCLMLWSLGVAAKEKVVIGVVSDGKSDDYTQINALFREEAERLLGRDREVEFPDAKHKVCDFTATCVNQALDQLLADPEVGAIIAEGTIASNLAVERAEPTKPLVAPFVVDLKLQKLPQQVAKKNLSYLVWSPDWGRDLKAFQRLASFKKLGVVVSKQALDALPVIKTYVEQNNAGAGTSMVVVPLDKTADSALNALPKDVDAVYVTGLFDVSNDEKKKLALGLQQRKLPSFAFLGREGVAQGFLAGFGSSDDIRQLARRSALNLKGLLDGAKADSLYTAFTQSEEMFMNPDVARAIGRDPDVNTLLDVKLMGTSAAGQGRPFTLAEAVREAMKKNLELAAAEQGILSSAEQVRAARARLLPELSVGAGARLIDKDRTALAGAEREASWSAQFKQSIYDERSWGGFTSEEHYQKAREHELRSLKLDVALAAALAYLDVLRSETSLEIQKQDLELSRQNLALARMRERVGTGGKEEVYRWEAEIANTRRRLIDVIALSSEAKVSLNTLLNRPATAPVATRELAIDDPSLLTSEPHLTQRFQSATRFGVLSDFMTDEAQRLAPELRAVDETLAGVQRDVTAEKRSYLLPSFALNAGVNHRFYEAGAGAERPTIPGYETPNSLDWQVGVSASLPLIEGGGHRARVRQGELRTGQLSLEKKALAREVERRVRNSLHQAFGSLTGIQFTRDAATASSGNLELVTEKYRQGTAAIIQLIDAQRQAVVADLAAANAVFDFLADLMLVERSVGRFNFLTEKQQTDDFFKRLDAYEKSAASRPPASAQ